MYFIFFICFPHTFLIQKTGCGTNYNLLMEIFALEECSSRKVGVIMKKIFVLLAAGLLSLSVTACGALVDLDTPKSSELKEEYSYYQSSADNIRAATHVTPEEADEIFIALVANGVDADINNVYATAGTDNSYSMWSAGTEYVVTLDGAVVNTISLHGSVIYPAQEETEATTSEPTEAVLTDKAVKKELKSSIDYYNDTVTSIIPVYAKKEDKENVIKYLNEAIERLDSDCDKYLEYMSDDNLSSDVQQACQNVKTAFYGISETVLKPMLQVMNGDTSVEVPDYGTAVIDAQTMYLDTAEKLID